MVVNIKHFEEFVRLANEFAREELRKPSQLTATDKAYIAGYKDVLEGLDTLVKGLKIRAGKPDDA